MILGIVGWENSGKTTVFNALTGAAAQTASFSGSSGEANMAVVKVPDPRLDFLADKFKPKKKTHVELKVMDFAPFRKGQGEKGFPAKHIASLRSCDALLFVARGFDDESVPNPEDTVNPARDIESLMLELAFADLEVVERRLSRIDESFSKSSKDERKKLEREKEFLLEVKTALEENGAFAVDGADEERLSIVRNYGLLTLKPIIAAVNVGDDSAGDPAEADRVSSALPAPAPPVIALAGKLEMEIAGLDDSERAEFMSGLGISEPARDRILRLAWDRLGLIVFFTVGDDECRAWAIRRGDNAVTAAEKIHSDIARGFIRAETTAYDDFVAAGGFQGAKDAGRFRLEGKTYIVHDGDILQFRFNV